MHVIVKKGLALAVAVTGLLAAGTGVAAAQATATGASDTSPGVGAGNNIGIPTHIPVCFDGNTVTGAGAANTAAGDTCTQSTGTGTTATGTSSNSPGVVAGNNASAPIDLPIAVTGNAVTGIGAGNSSIGNSASE
jgi:hypothetical protein